MEQIKEMENYINDEHFDSSFYTIYPFTTENIASYINAFDLKDKSLLTVGSSFDQVLNASLEGCKDITLLDICPNTKYYYYLKLASLLELDRESFLSFLCGTKYPKNYRRNPLLFDKRTYEKIKGLLHELDYESSVVWDYLFNNYSSNEIRRLFTNDEMECSRIIAYNKYLTDDKKYELTRERIISTKVSFATGSVLDITLDRKFDNIWLSNIGNYLNQEENDQMLSNMINYLNPESKLLAMYFYNSYIEQYRKLIKKYGLEKIIVPDENKKYDDTIYVYKK